MFDINAIKEKAVKALKDAQAIAKKAHDEARNQTGEEKQEFDRLITESTSLRSQIADIEKVNNLEAELNKIENPLGIGRDAQVVEAVKPTDRQLDAYRSFIFNGEEGMTNSEKESLRSLSLSGTSGYTAPQLLTDKYIEVLRNYSDIRQSPVQVFQTGTGNDLPFPTMDNTAENNTAVYAEAAEIGAADDPTIGRKTLKSFTVSSGLLYATKQFLRDSTFPAEQWIVSKLAEAIAIKQNNQFTVGAGSTAPQGIVTGVYAVSGRRVSLATGHATSLAAGSTAVDKATDLLANLNSVKFKVASRYRNRNAGWMFNDNTLKELSNYVDGNGRPLIQSSIAGLAQGIGLQLLDFPIYVNNDMADVGASAKSVLFGDFSNFYIRDVGTVSTERLVERRAEFLEIGFLGHAFCDSMVANESAFAILVNSAS